jgi:hypothetical protein
LLVSMMHFFLSFPTCSFVEAFFFVLGAVNHYFYMFLRLCSSKVFFVSQRFSLIIFLKNKGSTEDSIKED